MESIALAEILKFIFQYFFSPVICISLVIYIWKQQTKEIKDMKKRLDKNEKDISDFHFNYLDRFAEIKESNATEHTEIKVMLARICQKLEIEK